MTLPKEATCKYNLNRDMYKVVQPYCVWADSVKIPFPPRIGIKRYEPDLDKHCRDCNAWEPHKI